MKLVEHTGIKVRIMKPAMPYLDKQTSFQALNIPLRSRLYGLEPCGMETVWSECLTSYINRLGWSHGVAPRALAAQEIGPLLDAEWWSSPSPQLMDAFHASNAMSLNGLGNLAVAWSDVLERLTKRTDIHFLTAPWWIGDLGSRKNLRTSPAWCPACYVEWKERGLPLYQPLLWLLSVVTICPYHKGLLIQHCPHCQAKQAAIVSHSVHAGECTKCMKWLGQKGDSASGDPLNEETIHWQLWVIRVLEELRVTNTSSGLVHWEPFFTNLATAMKQMGSYSRLARLSGINREVLHRWIAGMAKPSFTMILKFCYICDTTPLQIMSGQFASLEQAIRDERAMHPRQHQRTTHRLLDRAHCLEVIQAMLDGRELPLGPAQLAKRLGCEDSSLRRFFPQECALLAQLAQTYRKQQSEQRTAQLCGKVRAEVKALHAQGISPTHHRVRRVLPPGAMRLPKITEAWHLARRELGLE